jgi:glycosyltransferase involved in cell wall biosynthesis
LKVVLVARGFPPEPQGESESSARALARALCAAGHAVSVVAGASRASQTPGTVEVDEQVARDDASGAKFTVRRLLRPDLHVEHWHKSLSPRVGAAFRRILAAERPDVVHVLHWSRLSRDLVLAAARQGVPAVASLDDAWTSCPIATRVRTDTLRACDALVAANPCLPCAGRVPPRTPWVPREAAHMMLAERQRDLARELDLARVCIVPSTAHARALERHLERRPGSLSAHVIAPMRGEHLQPVASLATPRALGHVELGAWGPLAPNRGQDVLIDALAQPGLRARVRLHIAGVESDVEFAQRLRERAARFDVVFHGAHRASELTRHPVARVHAMVSGSRADEAYGVELDQARELGLPALLPRSGAFAERAANPGSGAVLYEPGDAVALARVVSSWLADERAWPRLRDEARSTGALVPDDAQVLAATLATYELAIAAGAPEVAPQAWFEARMRDAALDEWDKSLASRTALEPGVART